MVTGATSLGLVRDELFATMEEAEQSLEHFIIDRNNGGLLQQAVENLKQVRGTLNLIELTGAELLAQEILQLATDIPVGAGEDRDVQLAALSNALYVLRRYLESVDASRQEILHFVNGHHFLAESIGTGFLGFHGANYFRPVFATGYFQGCYYFLSHNSIT